MVLSKTQAIARLLKYDPASRRTLSNLQRWNSQQTLWQNAERCGFSYYQAWRFVRTFHLTAYRIYSPLERHAQDSNVNRLIRLLTHRHRLTYQQIGQLFGVSKQAVHFRVNKQ